MFLDCICHELEACSSGLSCSTSTHFDGDAVNEGIAISIIPIREDDNIIVLVHVCRS